MKKELVRIYQTRATMIAELNVKNTEICSDIEHNPE